MHFSSSNTPELLILREFSLFFGRILLARNCYIFILFECELFHLCWSRAQIPRHILLNVWSSWLLTWSKTFWMIALDFFSCFCCIWLIATNNQHLNVTMGIQKTVKNFPAQSFWMEILFMDLYLLLMSVLNCWSKIYQLWLQK